jgi:hypothetical protein
MTGLNHAVTGALVAAAIKEPAIALPAAFLSHFAADAIPHWNYRLKEGYRQLAMIMDLTLLLSVLLILSVTVDASPKLIIAGGFLGALPDAMWLPYIMAGKKAPNDKKNLIHIMRKFHGFIQWSETSKGIYIEAAWLIITLFLIYQI